MPLFIQNRKRLSQAYTAYTTQHSQEFQGVDGEMGYLYINGNFYNHTWY